MPGPLTVSDLLDQVRDQLDESNQDDVSDSDILQALNRGQRKAANIIVKQAKDLLLKSTDLTSTGSDTFDVPEDAFGRRVDQVLVNHGLPGQQFPLKRVDFRDLHRYSAHSTTLPLVYATIGRTFVVRPTPASGTVLTVWYTGAPETLVLPQGRVTSINLATNYVLVDELGDDLTTSTDELGAYINIVDAQSGVRKVSLQTVALNRTTNQVTFKSSGLTRATVLNRTIDTAIPTTVEADDYLCAIQGTCVPDLPDACLDFLVQYAVNEIRRRMGEATQDEAQMLKELQHDLESQWSGREIARRISNKARSWTR